MSRAEEQPAAPWRPLATAAYFLAVLVVLAPAITLFFAAWPPHPSRLPWRHISSDLLIAAAPLIGAALVAILLAARVRGDLKVLGWLRRGGLVALILGAPFTLLYAVDSVRVYRGIPAEQTRSFVAMEARMFSVLAIGLGLLWLLGRTAKRYSGADVPRR